MIDRSFERGEHENALLHFRQTISRHAQDFTLDIPAFHDLSDTRVNALTL